MPVVISSVGEYVRAGDSKRCGPAGFSTQRRNIWAFVIRHHEMNSYHAAYAEDTGRCDGESVAYAWLYGLIWRSTAEFSIGRTATDGQRQTKSLPPPLLGCGR